ncbi:MAG: PAS domain S-box protein [Bacteroidota bacterium]|nr:PAS domain S-box protein [Bacteroidota bacterium]
MALISEKIRSDFNSTRNLVVLLSFIFGFFAPTLTYFLWPEKVGIGELFANSVFLLTCSTPFVLASIAYLGAFYVGKKLNTISLDLDHQSENTKRVTLFAEKIGTGNLNVEFQANDENDVLGNALINMRDNLIRANKKEEEQNWIITGVAEVGIILRSHNVLTVLADNLLPYLTKRSNAIQGALYILNDEDTKQVTVDMIGSYAYNKKKRLEASFKLGQGLVGAVVLEQASIFRTEIPEKYTYITSGLLGDKKPQSLLIVPLITDQKVYGVLEMASLNIFTEVEKKFLEELSDIIARTIFNLKVNERTNRLLAESQRMSSELKEQSVVLQQNAEEMQATQEELRRSNIKLEEQIQEVNNSQQRINVLLENSSEVIMICDDNAKIQYVSPSLHPILGYNPNEVIGDTDYSRISVDGLIDYKEMFETILKDASQKVTISYGYTKKNGEIIWLEVTGKNMLNNPSIKGIVLNIRDITERRQAEQEARMRSQMQSLSENSPDLITRINSEGKIYYINPTIEYLTDKTPDEFLRKTIFESGLNESVVKSWEEMIGTVLSQKQKIQVEMPFPTKNGSLIMNVNAIPEYNEDNNIESILLVSNDITERKKSELEIQNKNKKITESINYAQRIQVAILPEQKRIKELLGEYFMLYKPRDVVSGDFPWFVETEDAIYISAVDCTGHGVPGAMLSLIGYFLLNDIVKSQRITEPGAILDKLDTSVTKTLKQDLEGSEMKDGMDICLCKIDKNKKKLSYAGAHRPLYHLRQGEILEYKGNKFPIGGGLFKNQTEFSNHEIEIKKGDSFFFCSDGYPDQFGGPEQKKIGPAKIKSIILEHEKVKDFHKMEHVFNEFFIDWKQNGKQMDDVLLIGFRF